MIHKPSTDASLSTSPDDPSGSERTLSIYMHVHLVSDSTGETLTNVMKASITQFDHVEPIEHLYALVRSQRRMKRVLDAIEAAPGIVLYTMLDNELRGVLETFCREINAPCVPVLDPVLDSFSRYLGAPAQHRIGAQRSLDADYYQRMGALDFAMAHDDGQKLDTLHEAEVVLVGVSRTSKTPTSIYLAHRGVRAANVPLVPGAPIPPALDRLDGPLIVGLTTSPQRLVSIRRNRLLGLKERRETSYVDDVAVRDEVLRAKRLFEARGWPVIDVSRRSVEETAATIMNHLNDRQFGPAKV